jgi:hypothetical protein
MVTNRSPFLYLAADSQEPILNLSDAFGRDGPDIVREIEKAGKIVFHAVGSTGNITNFLNTGDQVDAAGNPVDSSNAQGQLWVADKMEQDFLDGAPQPHPSFFFLLGDIIYSFGESQYYYGQFYLPYVQYPAPIFAIAGNHDGLVVPGSTVPSLKAFMENFCAEGFHQTAASGGLGRTAQIQPGVYFTLEAPFLRILCLYSNTSEAQGILSSEHGRYEEMSDVQLRFLEAAFKRISKNNSKAPSS